jgi:hypothetical protein
VPRQTAQMHWWCATHRTPVRVRARPSELRVLARRSVWSLIRRWQAFREVVRLSPSLSWRVRHRPGGSLVVEMPETRYAKTEDGVHVAYQVVGEGPPDVVYANSFMGHIEVSWEYAPAVRFYERMAAFSRLVRLMIGR